MNRKIILISLTILAVLQDLFKVELSAFACKDDFECGSNSSSISICCSGLCEQWWNCPGGCISDDSCKGGKICYRHHCEEADIDFPAFCSVDKDCLKGEECDSGQCKPAPRPVTNDDSTDLQVSFDYDSSVVIIIGAVVGGLIFIAVVSYGSYRCLKRYRRRRFSRGSYSHPSRYVISFSPSRNEVETYSLYRQQLMTRISLRGRTGYTYPQTPPPDYDSVTIDSNLEVETSSPAPYDQEQVRDAPRTSEEQVCKCFSVFLVMFSGSEGE